MGAEGVDQVPVGQRVTLRRRLPDGTAADVVGTVVAHDAEGVRLHTTRRGEVRVPYAEVVVHRVVRPVPWRVGAFLRRAGVAVLDLDGVLRTFDTSGELARAEAELGLEAGAVLELAFGLPEARAMLTGRTRYAEWMTAVRVRLLADEHAEEAVERLLTVWQGDRGTPVGPTVALVDALVAAGTPAFVFTNGTDRVPEELEHVGLGRLVPMLLNAHDLGFAKPAPEAYGVAHAEIERRLGRTVGRAEVHFTDDRPGNVEAAREFGWQGRVFTPPAPGQW
ncbi:HAD family hydrolase [uncultured Ornithinimicrobium sp.]|uniref:HAD family hydrolase n=1 Tax=uncultured Ornithinimicrobium sp. TaxID=259307 RepID=UPI002593DD4D|nr:HAD family hydrolase [uncultured Ornithinimicrobium sp.]